MPKGFDCLWKRTNSKIFKLKTLYGVADIKRNLSQFQGFSFLFKNVSNKFFLTKYIDLGFIENIIIVSNWRHRSYTTYMYY
jgi:hypothetical protein